MALAVMFINNILRAFLRNVADDILKVRIRSYEKSIPAAYYQF